MFLPQWGCPHQCVYCNQGVAAPAAGKGAAGEGGLASVKERIAGLARDARLKGLPGELAFYGGTFTGLPGAWLESILFTAGLFVEDGAFSGIRFSTRPDALAPEVLEILDRHPVRTVELGVQSLSEAVLQRSRRGYGAGIVREAVRRVRLKGWRLGLQLMPGLPGDSRRRFMESVRGALDLSPDFVRIYPTLVLKGTILADWLAAGEYAPLTLDGAVEWSAAALDLFCDAGIPVIRMGLHPDPELLKPGVIVGGPFHPAFGYLVKVRRWRDRVDRWCAGLDLASEGRRAVVRAPREAVSEVMGPGRENLAHWRTRWGWAGIRVEAMSDWPPHRFEVFAETGAAGADPDGGFQDDDARREHESN